MKKFEKNDEGFVCENCGRTVKSLGYTSRNHCPYCLFSKHVDVNPGDRANECKGLMEPIGYEAKGKKAKKGASIVFKCQKCGEIKKNISAEDDDIAKMLEILSDNFLKGF
jgi:DNA-directed RNA polymerase subunit RPC12/RpoP